MKLLFVFGYFILDIFESGYFRFDINISFVVDCLDDFYLVVVSY